MYTQMDQLTATSTSSIMDAPGTAYRTSNRRSRHVYSTYIPNNRFSRYNNTLMGLIPVRFKKTKKVLAVQNSGLFSFITFNWIYQYLKDSIFNRAGVEIPKCPDSETCRVNSSRLDGLFYSLSVKQGQNNLSIFTVVSNFIRSRTIFACILYILASLISMTGLVLFLPKILNFEGGFKPVQYVLALMCTEFLSSIIHSWSVAINLRTAIRLRSACFASLYRQTLLTKLTYQISSWQLVSFLHNEGQNIQNLVMTIPDLICTPIILICCMLFAGLHLHLWGYVSVLIVFIYFPFFIIIGLFSKRLLNQANYFSDKRVKILEDFILNNIYVKFSNLEKWFKHNITETRNNELNNMRRAVFYENLCYSFIILQPFMSLTMLFLAFNKDSDLPTFAAIAIILLIHLKRSMDNFWYGLNSFIKGATALNKFKKIMTYDTIYLIHKKPKENSLAIFIEGANFQWTLQPSNNAYGASPNSSNYDENELIKLSKGVPKVQDVLFDINMSVEKGKLIGVCGYPGCGRSSLLLGIMGFLIKSKGKRLTNSQFAYVGQEPIIVNDTVKNNILFGNELDPQKYYRITMYCEIQDFMLQLPVQDDTIIESKYLTFEQKQRIVLARALYEDGEIYLLDDPLSGLDYLKSMRLFENCIKNSLQNKTVILVTDQIKFLEQCDEVYMLGNGRIISNGDHNYLMDNDREYVNFIEYLRKQKTLCKDKSNLFEIATNIPNTLSASEHSTHFPNYNMTGSSDSLHSQYDTIDHTVIQFKDNRENHIYMNVIGSYFSYFGNCCSLTFLFLSQVLNATIISCFPLYFLISLWTSVSYFSQHLVIYLGIFLWMLFLGILLNSYFNSKMFIAARLFHNDILKKMYRASLSFFQTKSLGILSTISVQLQLTDNDIPQIIQNIFLNFFVAIMTCCVLFFASPWHIIFVSFIVFLMILITIFIRKALSRFIKCGMSYSNSIYTEVLSMLKIRPIIQAHSKIEYFSKKLYDNYDEFMMHIYIIQAAKSWYDLLIHCCSVFLIGGIGFGVIFLVPACNVNAQSIFSGGSEILSINSCRALAIICILQICYVLHNLFVLNLNLGLNFDVLTQVHKFKKSITNDNEEYDDDDNDEEEEIKVLDEKAHSIKFVNITLQTNETVLIAMSFNIKENEKTGFLGLKSSEKKAIISALYRLSLPAAGNIFIDKKRMAQIPIKNLRSQISVVPSEPVFFNASVQKILNISKNFPETIFQVLQKFMLLERINILPNKFNSNADHFLNTEEKQILCLAQAYIKQTPIIIIEDFVNGSILEYILGSQIKILFPQSTMLIFGNDINGLQSCDTIIVIKDGKIQNNGNVVNIKATLSTIPETNF